MTTLAEIDSTHIHGQHDQVRDELRRADAKATMLLSLVSIAFAGIAALVTRQTSQPALAAYGVAAAPILASVLVLLSAIRPRLTQFPTPGTWLDAVYNGPTALLEASSDVARETLARDVELMGRIAVRKFKLITAAIHLLRTGLLALVAALALASLL